MQQSSCYPISRLGEEKSNVFRAFFFVKSEFFSLGACSYDERTHTPTLPGTRKVSPQFEPPTHTHKLPNFKLKEKTTNYVTSRPKPSLICTDSNATRQLLFT